MLVSATAAAKPAKRQSNWGQTTSGNAATSVTCAWNKKTLAGSLLIASVTYTGGTGTTVTAPGGEGWTLITAGAGTSGTSIGVAVFYTANASVRAANSTETFTLSASSEAALELTEFSGVVTATPLDVSFASGGAASPAVLSGTPMGGASAELSFAVWGLLSTTTTPGNPSGSFSTPINSNGTTPLANSTAPFTASTKSIHSYRLLTPASGPISTTLTPSPAVTWAGALVTFKVTSEYWIGQGGYPMRPASMPDPTVCYGYFDDDGCWSSTSGGVNDVDSPGSTDVVVFDGGGTGNVTFNAIDASQDQAYTVEVDAGYTGTMNVTDRAVNPDVKIGSIFTMYGGTFNVNASQVQFAGATTLSGSAAVFSGGSGTETFNAALAVTQGTMTLGSSSFTAGAMSVGSSTTTGVLNLGTGAASLPSSLTVKGTNSQFNVGSASLSINGATTVDNGGAINGQTATTLSFGNTLTVTNGTVDLSTSTATPAFTGATAIGTATTNGILKLNSGSVSLPSTLTVAGAGSIFNAGSTTLSIAKKVELDSGATFTGGTANVTFNTAATATAIDITNGSMNLTSAGTSIASGDVQVTAGTMTLGSGISGASITVPGALTVDGGTFTAGSAAVIVSGATVVNGGGILNGGTNTLTFGAVTVGSGVTSGTFNANAATNVSFAGTTKFQVASTFNGNTSSGTFAVAPTLTSTGIFSVGDPGTTGQWTFTAGAHFNNMPVSFPSGGGGGHLSVGVAQSLTFDGTVTSDIGSSSTLPIIDCNGCSATQGITVTFSATSTLNINGLELDNSVSTGVSIASGATYTSFRKLKFAKNAANGTGGIHLSMTMINNTVFAPGCYFDTTAANNVALYGVNTATAKTMRLILELADATTNGSGAGDAKDLDGDKSPDDGVGDSTSGPYFGSVVEWVAAAPSDTSGTAVGYPTSAFDWNTFQWYGVYVGYKDTSGGTNDLVLVRKQDGSSAGYSFTVPQTSGDIVGTPWWDTEATGDVHVVYVATSLGHVIKLVDNGSSLARPAGNWSTDFTSAGVSSITSPLIEDRTNLYFGGTDGSSVNRIFALQIATGAGEKTLVDNSPTPFASVGAVTAALSWAAYSGKTYVLAGSADVSNQAYVYEVDITGDVAQAVYLGSTGATAGINDSVTLINNRAYAVSDAGKLFVLDATLAGGLASITGFPYSAAASPIKFAPYVDPTNNNAYFGNNAGTLYVVDSTGHDLTGYPFALVGTAITSTPLYLNKSGVVAVGAANGFVYFVNRHNASNTPVLFHSYYVGTGSVSSVAYNPNTSEYMVSTSGGKLVFIKSADVPDPDSTE